MLVTERENTQDNSIAVVMVGSTFNWLKCPTRSAANVCDDYRLGDDNIKTLTALVLLRTRLSLFLSSSTDTALLPKKCSMNLIPMMSCKYKKIFRLAFEWQVRTNHVPEHYPQVLWPPCRNLNHRRSSTKKLFKKCTLRLKKNILKSGKKRE